MINLADGMDRMWEEEGEREIQGALQIFTPLYMLQLI